MKSMLLGSFLIASIASVALVTESASAQQPMSPPPGDMNPSQSEERKKTAPSKRSKHALPSIQPKRPPVVPPTPEKTAPDPAPTIE